MSKKNVALFIEAFAKQKDLNQKVSKADKTLPAWTALAKTAGYEFTDEELHGFMVQLLDHKVSKEKAIPEFLGAQSELGEAQLDQVAGGAARAGAAAPVPVSPNVLLKVQGIGGIGGTVGEWGTHVKGPFGSMPGGNQSMPGG